MAEERRVRTAWVAPHPDLGERVALWERNPDHPGGEVFIAGQNSQPVEVALTSAVLEALAPSGDRGEGIPHLVRLEGPLLEKRRALAEQAEQGTRLQSTVAAISSGASVADLKAAEKRDEELSGLREQIAKLQEELEQKRIEDAEGIKEQADKEVNDPKLREQRADELAELNADRREPAQVDTYDADEPFNSNTNSPNNPTRAHQRRRQVTKQPESTLAPGTIPGQGGV